MKLLKIITKSFFDFFRDGGLILAGSISYFTIMALVPFCLFLVTIFSYFLGHYHGFYQFLSSKLLYLFPDITSEITNQLGKLIAYRGIGALSLVLYLIFSLPIFSSIENAFYTIFKVKQKRTFFWSTLLSFIIVTLIILTIFISFIGASLIVLLKTLKPYFPELRIGLITFFLIRYIIPSLMILFTIMIIYIFLPKTKVKTYHAFTGALFVTVLLEIAKQIFTWYVGSVVNYGTIYGPMTAFIIFLLWVFYSSCIFLIGAEIVHNQGNSKK